MRQARDRVPDPVAVTEPIDDDRGTRRRESARDAEPDSAGRPGNDRNLTLENSRGRRHRPGNSDIHEILLHARNFRRREHERKDERSEMPSCCRSDSASLSNCRMFARSEPGALCERALPSTIAGRAAANAATTAAPRTGAWARLPAVSVTLERSRRGADQHWLGHFLVHAQPAGQECRCGE